MPSEELLPDSDPVIEFYKSRIDHTLLRENLRLTPDGRVRRLVARLAAQREQQRATERIRARELDTGQ